MPTINTEVNAPQMMAEAVQSGNTDAMVAAFQTFMEQTANRIIADAEANALVQNDVAAMAQRGYRQLTTAETKFYQRIIDARDSKQSFIDIFNGEGAGEEIMPETIFEDAFKDLAQSHDLLKHLRIQYVGYSTKWIINDSAAQKGAWGRIDAKIVAEIEGAMKVIDLTQNKYSAFVILPLAIIDLGPTYMDAYVRAVLLEAIALGLEEAIVCGTGVNMPIGLMYNPNSTFNQETGYEAKEAVEITSFAPAEYGAVVARMAKTEKGKERKFAEVQLLCNMTDYLTKIMPATTTLNSAGQYASNLFPFPTTPIICNSVPDGKAVLCLLPEYTLAAGGNKTNAVENDDSIGFLDHTRAWRCVNYYAGRAFDNTCAVVLDISNLDPAYITVMNVVADETPSV